ncbi:minor extracellular protease vpr [Purpureocillium lavendulum]|uniref:Minor extracellular protease vpr n=1 Tax=Purpureocillium lavendulum TaxID=1247861 RepID=A0AB34G6A3_9HYPO|nr:minor extracellular protease vpr [Purpureocillium lavendulum]
MWKALWLAYFVAATVAASFASSSSEPFVQDRVPGAYLFELEDGHDVSALHEDIAGHGTVRMHLDYKLFRGVSVQLHDRQNANAKAMEIAAAAAPAVKNVWPILVYKLTGGDDIQVINSPGGGQVHLLTNDTRDDDDVWSPHKMTQVDKLHAEGITGKGIKIAVIDSGIDYTHPALGGCFGKGCLVSFGHDLVGDAYRGSLDEPRPDGDPRDCFGHGTHVAGIIAARPNPLRFAGAAPGATLGAYKVFGCVGDAALDVIVAAYHMAYEDGADIITASIGAWSGWAEDPLGVAVTRIVERGVPCVAALGNDGLLGPFYTSSPADARGVIAAGSFRSALEPMLLSVSHYVVDGGRPQRFGYVPVFVPPGLEDQNQWDVKLPVYATSHDVAVRNDACEPLPDSTPDLRQSVVLIRNGGCRAVVKARNAAAKGARYILVYSNGGPIYPMWLFSLRASVTGAGMVLAETGEAMVAALKAGRNVTADMASPYKAGYMPIGVEMPRTGGAVSPSSTWGPGWRMELKPTAGTPGDTILSTRPNNSYSVESGTSMATPLMAGIVALIAEARGTLDPALMANLLSATAKPQLYNDQSGFIVGQLAPAFSQGGGLVQAHDAAYAKTMVEPPGLSFNDTDHFQERLSFVISNKDARDITYHVSHVPTRTVYTLSSNYSMEPSPLPTPYDFVDSHAALKFSEQSVTLNPGHRREVFVSAQPPRDVDAKRLVLWSGYIAINGSDGTSLSLPYQGLTGSLHDATVLGPKGTVFVTTQSRRWTPLEANSTVTLPAPGQWKLGDDIFGVAVNGALGSPQIRAYMVPLTTCPPKNLTVDDPLGSGKFKTIGQPDGSPLRLNGRQGHVVPFNGLLDSGHYAPAGKYKFVVYELHLYGDEKKLSDWDVGESQGFRIRYAR